MCSAVEWSIRARSLDLLIVKLSHGRSGQKGFKGRCWHLAIVVIGAAKIDEQVALCLLVTNALDEAAARRIGAGERSKVNRAAVLDIDRLRTHWSRDEDCKDRRNKSDHDILAAFRGIICHRSFEVILGGSQSPKFA